MVSTTAVSLNYAHVYTNVLKIPLNCRYWWAFVIFSFMLCLLLSAGNQLRYTEEDQLKMWVSASHPYRENAIWLGENKDASDMKANMLVVISDLGSGGNNVLEADVIKKMFKLRKAIEAINGTDNISWDSTCFRQRLSNNFRIYDFRNFCRNILNFR